MGVSQSATFEAEDRALAVDGVSRGEEEAFLAADGVQARPEGGSDSSVVRREANAEQGETAVGSGQTIGAMPNGSTGGGAADVGQFVAMTSGVASAGVDPNAAPSSFTVDRDAVALGVRPGVESASGTVTHVAVAQRGLGVATPGSVESGSVAGLVRQAIVGGLGPTPGQSSPGAAAAQERVRAGSEKASALNGAASSHDIADARASGDLVPALVEVGLSAPRPDVPASAVAGRLAEVEIAIARESVRRSIAGQMAGQDRQAREILVTAAGTAERLSPALPPRPLMRDPRASEPGRGHGSSSAANEEGSVATQSGSTGVSMASTEQVQPTGVPVPTPVERAISGAARTPVLSDLTSMLAPATELSATNPEPVPEMVRLAARGASVLAANRGGSIVMRLDPPALGPLRVELGISHGVVHADFIASTSQARAVLDANIGFLRERLESQGLHVERLSVQGSRSGEGAACGSQAPSQAQSQSTGGESRDRSDDGGDGRRQDAGGGESRGRRDGERSDARREDSLPVRRSFAREFGIGERGALVAAAKRDARDHADWASDRQRSGRQARSTAVG